MIKIDITNLEADLKWIQQELEKIKDPTFIEAIKTMPKYRKNVATDRISMEEYNKEINASIAQIESGHTYTHLEMGERIKRWSKQ